MTGRQMVKELRKMGKKVSYFVRKDGGIRITNINGKSFKGSEGNKLARELLGESLSERREKQLGKIKTPKGRFGNKIKLDVLTEQDKKEIARIQRLWHKRQVREKDLQEGMPTRKNFRYVVTHYGREEAMRLLNESERFAQGLVYTKRVETFVNYIKTTYMTKADEEEKILFQEIIDLLLSRQATLKETAIHRLNDVCYDLNGNKINVAEWHKRMKTIIEQFS